MFFRSILNQTVAEKMYELIQVVPNDRMTLELFELDQDYTSYQFITGYGLPAWWCNA